MKKLIPMLAAVAGTAFAYGTPFNSEKALTEDFENGEVDSPWEPESWWRVDSEVEGTIKAYETPVGDNNTKYLNIDTSGKTIDLLFDEKGDGNIPKTVDMETVMFESDVKFTATDTEPTVEEGAQFALWLKENEGETPTYTLMATCGSISKIGDVTATSIALKGVAVSNDSWHHVKIVPVLDKKTATAGENPVNGFGCFLVYVDGTLMSAEDYTGVFLAGYENFLGTANQAYAAAGQLFPSLIRFTDPKSGQLAMVGFNGTGDLDNITIAEQTVVPTEIDVTVPTSTDWTATVAPAKAKIGDTITVTYTAAVGKLFKNGETTMIATGTLAEGGDVVFEVTPDTAVQDPAAQIGTVLYLTLNAAIEAAEKDNEIKLLANATDTIVVPAGKDITIDFNDCTLQATWGIKNYGTLTIKNANITAQEGSVVLYGNSVTTIESGSFESLDNAVIMGQGNEGNGNVKLTINGGTFNGGITTTGCIACGIYVANGGTYAINGGTFNITNGCGVIARAGTTKIASAAEFKLTNSEDVKGWVGDKKTQVPGVVAYFDYEIPLYSGYKEGDAILAQTKYTTDEGQEWSTAADTDGFYTLQVKSEEPEAPIVVPEGETVEDVVTNATSEAEIEITDLTQVSWKEETHALVIGNAEIPVKPYYTVTIAGNKITFALNEQAKAEPATVQDAEGNEIPAVAVAENTVGVGVATKVGLWYGLETKASLDAETWTPPTSWIPGNGNGQALEAAKAGAQGFYRVVVSDIAPKNN